MSETRIHGALERLEKALARIETQAALPRSAPAVDDNLARAHEALKQRVAGNLRDLDALIGSLER